jgi:membrane protein DedA with SNARE-associated domain
MLALGAIIPISAGLGYLLPAIIGLESMGIPSPGETALVLAAVLASQGKLQIELVILIGVVSAIVGDNVGYLLGRRLGRDVLEAPGPFHKRRVSVIAAGDRFFRRHGPKAVFFARWIALVRFAAAWLAGINRMRFKQFFFWNALGGITWGITYGLVGYFGGKAAAHVLAQAGVIGAIVLAVVVVGGLALLKVREMRVERELELEVDGTPDAEPAQAPGPPSEPSRPERGSTPERQKL